MRLPTSFFQIGERVRVTACESYGIRPNDPHGCGLGTVMATLPIAPNYYDVHLDRTATRRIVFADELEPLAY